MTSPGLNVHDSCSAPAGIFSHIPFIFKQGNDVASGDGDNRLQDTAKGPFSSTSSKLL
jgi:hypothetical protein